MKKTFWKLMLVPAICTALTACDDNASLSTDLGESLTTGETSSDVSTIENSSSPIIVPENDTDRAVIDILDTYKNEDILENMMAGSFEMSSESDFKIDMSTLDKVNDNNDSTYKTDMHNSNLLNSFVSEEGNSLYMETSLAGDLAFSEYEEELVEDKVVPVQVGLDTDLDVTGRTELSDATYVSVLGKLPSTNIQPVDEMTEETPEEIAARSNFDFKGYSSLNYESYETMLTNILSQIQANPINEETIKAADEDSISFMDLDNDEEYLSMYNFLTGRKENGWVITSVDLNEDGTTSLNFSVDLEKVNIVGATSGKFIIYSLQSMLGTDVNIDEFIDDMSVIIKGPDKDMSLSITLDKDYLPLGVDVNINLDDTDIELKKDSETENAYDMNYQIRLNYYELSSKYTFAFGDAVTKKGFTDEEKADIKENGQDVTESINEVYQLILNSLTSPEM